MSNKKPKKKDLIVQLYDSFSAEQWNIIEQLHGSRPLTTDTAKRNYLNRLFVKSRSRASAKAIARNLQQWVAKNISEVTGLPWGKDEEIASREMGQSGPDVRLSERVRKLFPFTLECKSGEQWNVIGAIRQAKANIYPETTWMVCLDKPHPLSSERVNAIIVIDGETFFEIWKKYAAHYKRDR